MKKFFEIIGLLVTGMVVAVLLDEVRYRWDTK